MDFLDIRKKAKERAQARAAEEAKARAGAQEPKAGGERAPAGNAPRRGRSAPSVAPPPPAPVVTDEDVIEGALAARLQGIPAPGAPPEDDPRFTTWRPGSGTPPTLPPDLGGASSGPAPRDEDFMVVVPPARRSADEPRAAVSLPEAGSPSDPLDEFFYRPDEAAPALPQLAPAAPLPEEEPAEASREEYLTFLLGLEEYAIAVECVREVIRAPPVTEVPRAPGHILGVVSVRGEVVAVVDPRRRLGLPPLEDAKGQGKVVIVDAGEGPCGLLVDRVASVVRLRRGSLEPCPQGIAGQRSEFLAGIGRTGERLFTVLDLGALLRRAAGRHAAVEPAARTRRGDAGA